MKLVFMGTPDFAVGALEALLEAGHEVTAVVTQPDKPKGRSRTPQFAPVKACALCHGIPVLQFPRIKSPEAVARLKEYEAQIYIVAAFGQLLSQEILDLPEHGCLNIHASLLPKYRGASPIQHVILNGEQKTGITIMRMDAGLDTGAMLYKKEVELAPHDTYGTLHDRLMAEGGRAIVEVLALLPGGGMIPEQQREEESSYAPLITKAMGEMDFAKSAVEVERLVRAMNPWPSAYTSYRGRQVKIWEAKAALASVSPGVVGEVTRDFFSVGCGEGSLQIYSVQPEGKKRMSTHDFLLGVKVRAGERLGGSA
ncbi:MAG: methionyl-tRNA formyltransferase [Clostridium sp.]|nr:methionyl-tRNA formyltransferase [Clostridium sp.]